MTLLAILFVLGPLVFFHELGHFVVAKLAGVRVEEFGFGFPPRLFKFWTAPNQLTVKGIEIKTRHNVNLPTELALGRFVDVLVQQKEDEIYELEQIAILDPKTDDLTPLQQAQANGLRLRGKLTKLERGTEYTFNWILMGAFVRMTGEENPSDPFSLAAQPKRWRAAVLLAGPMMNLIVAALLFAAAFWIIGDPEIAQVVVINVAQGSPAQEAGLKIDDVILMADDDILESVKDLQDYTYAHEGQTILLTIERDDQTFQSAVLARENPPTGEGPTGISIDNHWVVINKVSVLKSLQLGVEHLWKSLGQLVSLPMLLVRQEVSVQEVKPVGPIRIVQFTNQAIQATREESNPAILLGFAGVISLALGTTNLLPLPALDGGRLMFVALEVIRRRRISPEKEGLVHIIGMGVLLVLFFVMAFSEMFSAAPKLF